MVLCPVPGSEGVGPLVQLTLVSQAGGPRGRIYFPYIAFRVTRPLQARTGALASVSYGDPRADLDASALRWCLSRQTVRLQVAQVL